ncbi:MAG: hypothetical protein HYT28_01110 [Parcubacteria group bacterium]|nr:hypothetical protein [Parcubacteria group bacterium]
MHIEIKKLENSELEITGELPMEAIEAERQISIKTVSETVAIDGFRKGHIPEKILIENIGEMALLEEMAERALKKAYPDIIKQHEIDAIGRPLISITKLAKGNPLGFKIKTAVTPEIILPDYKKIAKEKTEKKEDISVTDDEVEKVVAEILKSRADKKNQELKENVKEEKLPELTDTFVKTLGDFKNVADFKQKLRENITHEKEAQRQSKRRMTIAETIIEKSAIPLPRLFVDVELEKMLAQFKGDISRMGLKFDEYLKHIKKTEEDLLKEWVPDAEKRSKFQLVLNEIARREHVLVPNADIEKEIAHIMEHYKDADRESARVYVETILKNELVFKLLEKEE